MSTNNVQLVMVVDQKRCIGCHSCAIACKLENNIPKDKFYNRVYTNKVVNNVEDEVFYDDPAGTHTLDGNFINTPTNKKLITKYYTKACQHCENPPCVEVCAYNATYKRKKDGVVVIDYDKCIGCDLCISACPYNARVKMTDTEEYYEYSQDIPVGGQGIPPHKPNTVEKCTFCTHRIDNGEQPACVEACPARARFVGIKDNPSSEVYELLHSGREIEQIYEDNPVAKATRPSVYFLK